MTYNSLDARALRAPGGAIDGLSVLTAELLRGPREARRLQLEADRQAESDRRASVMEALATQRGQREEDAYRAAGIANGTIEADPGNPAEWESAMRGKRQRESQAASDQLNVSMLRAKGVRSLAIAPDLKNQQELLLANMGEAERDAALALQEAKAKRTEPVGNFTVTPIPDPLGPPKSAIKWDHHTGKYEVVPLDMAPAPVPPVGAAPATGASVMPPVQAPAPAPISTEGVAGWPRRTLETGQGLIRSALLPSDEPGINRLGDLNPFFAIPNKVMLATGMKQYPSEEPAPQPSPVAQAQAVSPMDVINGERESLASMGIDHRLLLSPDINQRRAILARMPLDARRRVIDALRVIDASTAK